MKPPSDITGPEFEPRYESYVANHAASSAIGVLLDPPHPDVRSPKQKETENDIIVSMCLKSVPGHTLILITCT